MKRRHVLSLLAVVVLALAGTAVPEIASAQATCVNATAGTAPAATLSWTVPTTNTDGTPIATPLTYNVLQSTTPGAEAIVQSGVVGSSVNITTGLLDGTTYYYKVQVKDAKGTLSALSNEACITFPVGVPAAVTITVTQGP